MCKLSLLASLASLADIHWSVSDIPFTVFQDSCWNSLASSFRTSARRLDTMAKRFPISRCFLTLQFCKPRLIPFETLYTLERKYYLKRLKLLTSWTSKTFANCATPLTDCCKTSCSGLPKSSANWPKFAFISLWAQRSKVNYTLRLKKVSYRASNSRFNTDFRSLTKSNSIMFWQRTARSNTIWFPTLQAVDAKLAMWFSTAATSIVIRSSRRNARQR